MKIVDVKTYPLSIERYTAHSQMFFLAKVITDEGVFGFGEASSTYGHCYPLVVQEIVEGTFKRILIGEDPLRIENLITKMRTYVWWVPRIFRCDLSVRLLLLKSRLGYFGEGGQQPVYKLLGGDKEAVEYMLAARSNLMWTFLHCERFKRVAG